MHPYAAPTRSHPDLRPTISEVVKGPTGASSFLITFRPGQELPTHRNASRIMINVLEGDGTISIDDGQPARVVAGAVVQIGPHVPHALVSGEAGLTVEVHLVADCCSAC